MKITVAMRVVGGFALITVLLLILGIVAVNSLRSIENATDQVNTLTIPTVSGSSQLKVSFLNMGRLTTEAYYETELSELKNKQASFEKSKNNFDSERAWLAPIFNWNRRNL